MPTSANTADKIIGRELLRVSVDASGRERSPDEQHRDHGRAAPKFNFELHPNPYREVGSASQFRSRERKEFPRLLRDLKDGNFGAQLLILWEGARGSRDVGEWYTLVGLCKLAKVKIYIHTKRKIFDPNDPLDENDLYDDAVKSARRAAEISVAVKRAMDDNFEDGKPHGRIPFGYVRRYDESTRRFIEQVPHPEEAKVIRDLYARLLKGHSLRRIAADFKEKGITTRESVVKVKNADGTQRKDAKGRVVTKKVPGHPFSAQHLRTLALTPTYAGLRSHDPNRVNGKRGNPLDFKLTEASWEPIVEVEDFYTVRRMLTDPKRVTVRPGRGVHLLSMIARCDVCGGVLTARTSNKRVPEYTCHAKSCIRVAKADLDEYAKEVILKYLASKEFYAAFTAGEAETSAELKAARAEVAKIESDIADIRARVRAERLSGLRAADLIADMERPLERAQERAKQLERPQRFTGVLAPGEDARQRWEAAPMEVRRTTARVLLSADLVGELRIMRSPTPGHRCDVAERITRRRTGDQ